MKLHWNFVEKQMGTRKTRRYTEAFRADAVQQDIEGKRSLVDVARGLEMSSKTLENWVRRARSGQPLLKRPGSVPVSEEQAELSRLRAENARLRMEKEILKKAAAYFAKESM